MIPALRKFVLQRPRGAQPEDRASIARNLRYSRMLLAYIDGTPIAARLPAALPKVYAGGLSYQGGIISYRAHVNFAAEYRRAVVAACVLAIREHWLDKGLDPAACAREVFGPALTLRWFE